MTSVAHSARIPRLERISALIGGRRTGATDHLPAVALTAYGRVEDRVEVFAAGFDSHVVKPVDPAELAAVIKRLVEARSSGNDKASPRRDT